MPDINAEFRRMVPAVNPLKRFLASSLELTGLTSAGFALQRALLSPYLRVVYCHDVPHSLSDSFAAQLELLKREFVPASRDDLISLLRGGPWPYRKPGLMLTFDDGLRSHSEVVAPILDHFGFQGWFFVPIRLILLDPRDQPRAAFDADVIHSCDTDHDPRIFMDKRELLRIAERHIIGCHTANHVRLASTLTPQELQMEIVDAKQRLEAVIGRPVDSFSWVGGEERAYSSAAARHIASAFSFSFTTNTRLTRANTPLLQIDRTHLEPHFSPALARMQMSGLMDLLYVPKRRRLRPCFTD